MLPKFLFNIYKRPQTNFKIMGVESNTQYYNNNYIIFNFYVLSQMIRPVKYKIFAVMIGMVPWK